VNNIIYGRIVNGFYIMSPKNTEEKILSPEFLEEIKRVREERNITVKEVAEKTNIKESYITAIEEGNLSALPGGVYNKAYIRSISEFLNISTKPYEKIVDESEAAEAEKIKVELGKVEASNGLVPSKAIILISTIFIVIFVVLFSNILKSENNKDEKIQSQADQNIEGQESFGDISSQISNIVNDELKVGIYAKEEITINITKISSSEDVATEKNLSRNGNLDRGQILFLNMEDNYILATDDFSKLKIFVNGVEIKNTAELLDENSNIMIDSDKLYSLFRKQESIGTQDINQGEKITSEDVFEEDSTSKDKSQ
jgi:transcriptional regulator with XRE-family HTH domain